MKPYRIFLLGGVRFQSEARTVTRFRTQKTATLLAYLALHRGPQPREVLADLLWPDDAPDDARHSLRMALSSLRSQLETSESGQLQTPIFEATRFAIGLRTGAVSTDVADFDEAIKNARRAPDTDERARHYSIAIELYGGAFLPGFYDDWCLETAARLETEVEGARQFIKQWREQKPTIVAHSPNSPVISAPARAAAHLATLLIFDGANPTRELARGLKASGGAQQSSHGEAPQSWIFPGTGAAWLGATLVRNQTRRIALCTGEVSAREPTTLETRARGLLESAWPGQIVCCEATALFERERGDAVCRELGIFHLPNALPGAAPERVFQIVGANETAREFEPLRARRARGARVPRPLDVFFGRQNELDELRARVQNDRLVTLLALGGAGKTRLALQLAASHEIERGAPFYGAVCWVALADVAGADGIAPALCDALHLERVGQTSAIEAATAALHLARSTLLILDNFEHLVEDGAAIIEALLERAPHAHCLVTSRRLLGARGETEFTLAPLPTPDDGIVSVAALRDEPSVQLFCNRARLVRPDFTLNAHNAAAVAALCRHLEGLPLALELAAARVAQLAPARILERLKNHAQKPDLESFDWLRNTARTAPARHRSLGVALRWSVDELAPELRQLLARLSAFRGGFDAGAAAEVCRAPDAADELEELRARALLARSYDDDEARYSMLETVRHYAAELARQSGETHDLQRRHARYFLSWAQSEAPHAVAPDAAARVQSWARVRTRADNLRAALRWARHNQAATALQLIVACHDFSGAHLSHDELDIASVLAKVPIEQIDRELLAVALKLAAVQAAHHGDIAAQNEFALRHLDLIRESPDATPETLGWAYFNWGSARHRSGHFSIARAALQQSLQLFAQLPAPQNHQCHGWTLTEMGNTAFDAGDLVTAAADFAHCDDAFGKSGDRDGQASARSQLADVCFHAGDGARAATLWAQVEAIMTELADEREHEWRRHQQGKHALAQGDLERGHALLLRALRAFKNDGQKLGMLRSLLGLSYYWLACERVSRARQLLQVEAAERAQLGWPADLSWEPLRQQMWQQAGCENADEELPSLAQVVASELLK